MEVVPWQFKHTVISEQCRRDAQIIIHVTGGRAHPTYMATRLGMGQYERDQCSRRALANRSGYSNYVRSLDLTQQLRQEYRETRQPLVRKKRFQNFVNQKPLQHKNFTLQMNRDGVQQVRTSNWSGSPGRHDAAKDIQR